MTFPTQEQSLIIRTAKSVLEKDLNSLLGIFGPYEKRLSKWYVSGGCIASIIRGEKPNDYDIYFEDMPTMAHVNALITQSPDLLKQVKDIEENYRDVKGKDGKCITENAITMKNGLQFIIKHCGNADSIRSTFDFVHCMPYYSFRDHRLRISEDQYVCCKNKILKINCRENATVKRIEKFKSLGYTVYDEEVDDYDIMEIIEDKVN